MSTWAMAVSSSPPGGNRLFRGLSADERRSQRHEQLIEAGLRAFGSRGFHEVGVRDICAEAHLTERYFYESFENREALFLAVYERGVGRIRDAIVAALEKAQPEDMARAGLRAFLCLLRDEPLWPRIILIDVLTVGPTVGSQSFLATQGFADMVGNIVGALYPDRDLDPQLVASGLVGSTVSLVMRWAQGGFVEPLDKVLDHCALFYEALMIGHVAQPLAPGSVTRSAGS
jgi:AcrR family transcriptional regulator